MNENIAVKASQLMDKAVSLHNSNDFSSADNLYQQVLDLCPGFPDALHLKGLVHLEFGKSDSAEQLISNAIRTSPQVPQYHLSLGRVYHYKAGYSDAIASCKRALELKPDFAEAFNTLGLIYREIGELNSAIDCFEQAIRLDDTNSNILTNYASTLAESGSIGKALSIFLPLGEKRPDDPVINHCLGYIYELDHDIEKARQYYLESTKLNPRNVVAYTRLAVIDKHTPDNNHVQTEIEKLLNCSDITDKDKSSLHFALGKIYQDCRDYDLSFHHYKNGNDINRLTQSFNRESHLLFVSRTITTFTESLTDNLNGAGSDSEVPVFILGMPRSGTSLVEQIVSSHPDVRGAGELSYLYMFTRDMHKQLRTTRKYPRCMKHVGKSHIRELADRYLGMLGSKSGSVLRITDKTPGNYLYIGLIFLMFPKAKIIHCHRDPMDVCFSNYIQKFSRLLPYSCDLADIGFYYIQYQKLMMHWEKLFPGRIHHVSYETLVNDKDEIIKGMIDYCGLPWNDRCLFSHENKRFIRTASDWQVRQPIYTSSIKRWKHYEKYLGPLLEALGYQQSA